MRWIVRNIGQNELTFEIWASTLNENIHGLWLNGTLRLKLSSWLIFTWCHRGKRTNWLRRTFNNEKTSVFWFLHRHVWVFCDRDFTNSEKVLLRLYYKCFLLTCCKRQSFPVKILSVHLNTSTPNQNTVHPSKRRSVRTWVIALHSIINKSVLCALSLNSKIVSHLLPAFPLALIVFATTGQPLSPTNTNKKTSLLHISNSLSSQVHVQINTEGRKDDVNK